MVKSLVHGVGLNDADYAVSKFQPISEVLPGESRKLVWRCPYYSRWKAMLKRCYYTNYQKDSPTYKGCYVCDEWLRFSNFKRWMETQDWEGKQLDKDLLIRGNKIYSPETCVFISGALNSFMTESEKSRGKYPLGVSLYKDGIRFAASCHNPFTRRGKSLGVFLSSGEAHEAWLKRKREHVISYITTEPDKRIIHALIYRYWSEDDYEDVADEILLAFNVEEK